MTQQLDRSTGRLDEIRDAVAEAKDALSNLQIAAAPGGKGVDPNKRYTVDTKGSPAMGPDTAPVTIVEFSDFQCPFCGRVGPTLKQIKKEYGDQVRIVFKHQPLSFHAKAPAAHAAAEAAHRQGKFWEMHDKIFADQKAMSPEKYVEYATELELDVDQFKVDVASADVKKKVDADVKEAAKLGSTGTPGFFVNGLNLKGAKPFEAFKEIIDKELKKKKKKA
jgi:protein-disulfide isomerase